MKSTIALCAACAVFSTAPLHLRAGDAAAPAASAGPAIGRKHLDPNAWLEKHPKLKDQVLAQFDTNKNSKLDGDEIPAFVKWLKARQAKRKESTEDGGRTTRTTPPAITSPIVTQ